MKSNILRTAIAVLIVSVAVLPLAAVETDPVLSEAQVEDILFLMEEEKLARDLYVELADAWNLRVFANISKAEETHRSRVEELAVDYGLEYSVLPAGEFSITEIQALYDELLSKGLESRIDALEVGRTVEIVDIEDLEAMIAANPPEDIVIVYERLKEGSERHLDAFERQLDR